METNKQMIVYSYMTKQMFRKELLIFILAKAYICMYC